MKVAIYARVSSDEQADKETIITQLEAVRSYCEQQGHEVTHEYKDEAVSGTVRFDERPAGRELMAAAERGAFRAVVVYRLDRLARNVEGAISTHNRLRTLKAPVVSVVETFDDSATGRLMFNIIVSFGEYEREVIADRMASGRNRYAREGHALAIGTLPRWLRWDGERVILVEDQARQITGLLNAYGHSGIGGDRLGQQLDLDPRSVYNALTSPTVAGRRYVFPTRVDQHTTTEHQKTRRHTIRELAAQPTIEQADALAIERGLIIQQVPSLIDWARFAEIQQRITKMGAGVRGRPPKERLPLQGRVFCSEHGLAYTPEHQRGGRTYAFCLARKGATARKHGGCTMPRLRWFADAGKVSLVSLVREALEKAMASPEAIDKAARDHLTALQSRVDQLAAGTDDLEADLEKVKGRKTRLGLLWADGDLPDAEWRKQKNRLDQQITDIEGRLNQDDAEELRKLRKRYRTTKALLATEPVSPLSIDTDAQLARVAVQIDLRVYVEADCLRLEAALPLGDASVALPVVDSVKSSSSSDAIPFSISVPLRRRRKAVA